MSVHLNPKNTKHVKLGPMRSDIANKHPATRGVLHSITRCGADVV